MKKILYIIPIVFLLTLGLLYTPGVFWEPLTPGVSDPLAPLTSAPLDPAVLGEADVSDFIVYTVNVPTIFNAPITAPNILYSVSAGTGIKISEGQDPTISNTGVFSLQGSTGVLTLESGNGITIEGLKISSSAITSLSAGDGITVDGNKISTSAYTSLSAGDGITVDGNKITNTGILSLVAGSGIFVSGNTITNTMSLPDYSLSGWSYDGTTVTLSNPSSVIDLLSAGITGAGTITGATGFTSSGQITLSDLSTGIVHSDATGLLSSSPVNLTSGDVTGVLSTISGGTGLSGYTKGNLLYGSDPDILSNLGIGAAGEVLTVVNGVPAWATIAGGSGGMCANCLVVDPGSTQVVTANTDITPLSVRGYSSGSADIFAVANNDGSSKYLTIDATGNIVFGNGTMSSLNTGIFSVNPSGSDPISISPVGKGSAANTGTITSQDLTQNRVWTFPDQAGTVCTSDGNCTGTSSSLGGSGTAGYLSKWQAPYSLTNSLLFEDGTSVGIGTTNPGSKLSVAGTSNITGATTLGSILGVSGATTLSSSLGVSGNGTLSSTLGVSGATTLSSTVSITGNTTIGGNLTANGAGTQYIAGNVGIGTSTPTSKLDVAGAITSEVTTGQEAIKIQSGGLNKMVLKYIADGAISMDISSSSTANKFTNPSFDSNITGWQYGNTLLDTFSTDTPAGSVNGSLADTGQTRTVVDTNNRYSITGGNLYFSGGGTGVADPRLSYPLETRSAGKALIFDLNHLYSVGTDLRFGLGTTQTAASVYMYMRGNNGLSTNNYAVGTYTTNTPYSMAIVMRGTGFYYFIKGGAFTNYTLLDIGNTLNNNMYPVLGADSLASTFSADNVRIPTTTWLPAPLAYSTFTTASVTSTESTGPDGQNTPSLALTGGSVSSGKLAITPTLGNELVTNGDLTTDTNWTKGTGWTIGSGIASKTSGTASGISQAVGTVGGWYQTIFTLTGYSAGNVYAMYGNMNYKNHTANGTFTETNRSAGNTNLGYLGDVTFVGSVDGVSYKPLSLSSLFSTVSTSDSDVIVDTNVTLTTGTQAGLVLNLDSTSSPQNFVLVYHDGTNIKVEKVVNGVYTTIHSSAQPYFADGTLRVIKDGTKYRVYYVGYLIGTEFTISDAGIISNTKHGLFSTYSGNTFDNFTLWDRSGYTDLPETNLTATAETSVTYGGSAGSTKLVSSTSGSSYTQSINVGDTSTYTLSSAVYTNGSAVTSADLELTAGGVLLPTTFTSLGAGWYRAQANVVGVASAKNYGVYVHANKTVYVDNLSLLTSSALAGTLNIQDTQTGLGQLTVESTTTLNSGLASLQALIVKGAVSQTANLQEWQDSTGTVLGSVSATGLGTFTTASVTGATNIGGMLTVASTTGTDAVRLTSGGNKILGISNPSSNMIAMDLTNSTSATNLLLNGTFETDLTSWSEVPSYTLNDQFTTTRTAGAVNGTSAEPTGGTRTVVDATSALSISGGQLGVVAGGTPNIRYSSVSRLAGRILTLSKTPGLRSTFTFYTGAADENGFYHYNQTELKDIGGTTIATTVDGITYTFSVVLKANGSYLYIKGGAYTNWTLLWISNTGSTSTLYPSIASGLSSGTFTADNIRIPTSTWLPTPLAYSTFSTTGVTVTETVGPDSQATPVLTLNGGTVAGGTLSITPSLGSELIDGWTNGITWPFDTLTTSGSNITSAIEASSGRGSIYKNTGFVNNNKWFQANINLTLNSGTAPEFNFASTEYGSAPVAIKRLANGSNIFTNRVTLNNNFILLHMGPSEGATDFSTTSPSVKHLDLSSLFSTVSTTDTDVIADTNVTMTAGTQAGLVLNLDSTSSPANFVIAYHDGTNVKLEKSVAGTYTTVQTTAVAYSAGATLRVIKDGTKYRVYYNNALVGAEQTISDAGIISNTKHGLFSTYSGNTFDNFTLWPRGSSTTKFTDAPFEELTATLDTGTKYNGSTGSVKLIASGTDANYLQSVNAGSTASHTLMAYAYTNGSAVTATDLSLYAGTSALPTNYTSVGNGWYRLTASLAGTTSAKDYGVRVKAGKTVYVDQISLTLGSSSPIQTLYVTNSGTGTAGLNVQDTTTLNSGSAITQALIVKGFSTDQTANLQEWQNSGGTTLGAVSNQGLASFNSMAATVATGGEGFKLTSAGVTKGAFKYIADGSTAIDTQSSSANNKFTNSSFDAGITSWNYGNTLLDTFSTDLAAGSVNGTSADVGGTRTVADSGSKLSIGNGVLNFALGTSATISYSSQARQAGSMIIGTDTVANSGESRIGWLSDKLMFAASNTINVAPNSGSNISVATYTGSGTYQTANIMRSSGIYNYIKGGSEYPNWTLLWVSSIGTGALTPHIGNFGNVQAFSVDNFRTPTTTWLPTPLAYSTFASNGATSTETTGPDAQTTPSLALTGGTVTGGILSITPTLGSELNGDVGFDNAGYWTGTATVTGSKGVFGSGSTYLQKNSLLTIGQFYQIAFDVDSTSGGQVTFPYIPGTGFSTTTGAKNVTGRSGTTSNFVMYDSNSATVDNLTIKPLTLSSLFSTVSTSDSDVIADATVTLTAGTQAGIVTNLDSTSNPQNFIIVYHDGTNLKVDEAVNGVYTNKQSTAVAIGAGALRVIRDGTKLRAYLNNALVGAELTMTANTNTKHGLFSTYSGNTFDNFTLWDRSGYTDLPETNLTATAETSVTYGGSAGSTKLVASTSGASYTQSVNVGDTSTYTISTAIYSNGTPVTAADAELTAGAVILPTTFTSLGAGWYRATASVTGVASTKNYGVYVHAGKTVYVDNLVMLPSTGLASTFNVQNTQTGLGQLAVESTTTMNSGLASLQAMIVRGTTSQTANLTEWQNIGGTTLTSIGANGLLNATTGGLATFTKAGTISDSDFLDTPVNGLMAIDTSTDKLYIRSAGVWKYIAFTGGFQIPDYEGVGMEAGDFLMPFIEKRLSDGSLHGLYSKFSDVKDQIFKDELDQIATLSAQVAGLATASASQPPAEATADDVGFLGMLNELKDKFLALFMRVEKTESEIASIQTKVMSGRFSIPQGSKIAKITFNTSFAEVPRIYLTSMGELRGQYSLSETLNSGFTLQLTETQNFEVMFTWIARVGEDESAAEVINMFSTSPSATPIPSPSLEPTPIASESGNI